jgi:hypothetical protein
MGLVDVMEEYRTCSRQNVLVGRGIYAFAQGNSLVGVALGYGLDDRGSRVRFPAEAGNFSLHHRVQNGSEGPPSLLSNGYQGFFPLV